MLKSVTHKIGSFHVLVGVIACLYVSRCYSDNVFPDIPKKNIPHIKSLPLHGEIVLETRSTVLSGDQILTDEGQEIEIGVFNLENESESVWDLPSDIHRYIDPQCGYCNNRASWASKTRQLFLAMRHEAYLISSDGSHIKLNLKMPGKLVPYDGMEDFAISDDGQLLAYGLLTRDLDDKTPNPNDPYAATLGKLYRDLMYQNIQGSKPISIAGGQTTYLGGFVVRPAWSPDDKEIAYVNETNLLVVADITGKIISSTNPFKSLPPQTEAYITEVRWSPDGKKLGFIVFEFKYGDDSKTRNALYTVNRDGSDLRAIGFDNKNIHVSNFAWSPSGKKFVFRSDYGKKEMCNFNLIFLIEASRSPCREGEYLFISNVDGSGLRKISKEPEFRRSQLFWIQ